MNCAETDPRKIIRTEILNFFESFDFTDYGKKVVEYSKYKDPRFRFKEFIENRLKNMARRFLRENIDTVVSLVRHRLEYGHGIDEIRNASMYVVGNHLYASRILWIENLENWYDNFQNRMTKLIKKSEENITKDLKDFKESNNAH